MAIHTKDIIDDSVVATVKNAHKISEEQFCLFVKERFIDRSKPVTDPRKKNNLPTFSTPTKKAVSKDQAKVKLLKEDCCLFGWLYIACQTRDKNLDEFFSYENQPWPPPLSDQGQLRGGQKADLLKCLPQATSPVSTPPVDAVILDGAVIVQMLEAKTSRTKSRLAKVPATSNLASIDTSSRCRNSRWSGYCSNAGSKNIAHLRRILQYSICSICPQATGECQAC